MNIVEPSWEYSWNTVGPPRLPPILATAYVNFWSHTHLGAKVQRPQVARGHLATDRRHPPPQPFPDPIGLRSSHPSVPNDTRPIQPGRSGIPWCRSTISTLPETVCGYMATPSHSCHDREARQVVVVVSLYWYLVTPKKCRKVFSWWYRCHLPIFTSYMFSFQLFYLGVAILW